MLRRFEGSRAIMDGGRGGHGGHGRYGRYGRYRNSAQPDTNEAAGAGMSRTMARNDTEIGLDWRPVPEGDTYERGRRYVLALPCVLSEGNADPGDLCLGRSVRAVSNSKRILREGDSQ